MTQPAQSGQWRPGTKQEDHYGTATAIAASAYRDLHAAAEAYLAVPASDQAAAVAAIDVLTDAREQAALAAGFAQVEATLAVADALRELARGSKR